MDKNHSGENICAPEETLEGGGLITSLEGGGMTPGAGLVLPGLGVTAGTLEPGC